MAETVESSRETPWWAALLGVVLAVATGIGIGMNASIGAALIAGLPIGIAVTGAILMRPAVGLIGVAMAAYSPFVAYARLNLSPLNYAIVFGLLSLTVLAVLLSMRERKTEAEYSRAVITGAILFAASVAGSAVYGLLRGNPINYVASDTLQVAEFLIAFLIGYWVFRQDARIRFVAVPVLVVWSAAALWEIMLFFRAPAGSTDLQTNLTVLAVEGVRVARGISVMPSLILPLLIGIVLTSYRSLESGLRVLVLGGGVITGFSVVISFTRSIWAGVAVAIASMVFLISIRTQGLKGLRNSFAGLLAVGLVLIAIASAVQVGGTTVLGVAGMRAGATSEQLGAEENIGLATRLYEYVVVVNELRDQPFFGEGMGALYHGWERGVWAEKHWIHNSFLAVMFRQGLVGFAALLYFAGATVFRFLSVTNGQDPLSRGIAIGSLGSLIALGLQALLIGTLFQHPVGAVAGLIMAAGLVAAENPERI